MDMAESENEVESDKYIMYGESALLILLFIAGLAANVPVLILYFRSKHIRSITDKFLLNLLLADIASVILVFPSILSSFVQTSSETEDIISSKRQLHHHHLHYNNGTHLPKVRTGSSGQFSYWHWDCAISNAVLAGLAAASVIAALEIAMERYLAVVKPLHYHKFLTTPSIFITSIIGGIISLVTAIIAAIEPNFSVFPHCLQVERHVGRHIYNTEIFMGLEAESGSRLLDDDGEETMMQGFLNPNSSSSGQIIGFVDDRPSPTSGDLIWSLYSLTSITFLFVIPVILMIYIYTKIWLEARRQKIKIANQYKPYFLPVPQEHQVINAEFEKKKAKKGAFFPIIIKFRLMNRLRATRLDRAGRVAVVALVVTIICWSPYYYLKAYTAMETIMTMYGYESHQTHYYTSSSHHGSSNSTGWSRSTTVLPLLFAALHPLLSPLFYAYRYKRMRTEICKLISSLCVSHDQTNANYRMDGKSRANSTINTNISTLSGVGGTPIIRQTIITQHPPILQSLPQPHLPLVVAGLKNHGVKITLNHDELVLESHDDEVAAAAASVTSGHRDLEIVQAIDGDHNLQLEDDSILQTPKSHICINIFSSEEDDQEIGNGALEPDLEDTNATSSSSPNSLKGGIVERSVGNFFNYLNVWVNSYSRRWLQHRESVTSTASFITLLSSKYHNKTHTVANV